MYKYIRTKLQFQVTDIRTLMSKNLTIKTKIHRKPGEVLLGTPFKPCLTIWRAHDTAYP